MNFINITHGFAAAAVAAVAAITLFLGFAAKLFGIRVNSKIIALEKRINFTLGRAAGNAFAKRSFCLSHFFQSRAEHAEFCAQSNPP